MKRVFIISIFIILLSIILYVIDVPVKKAILDNEVNLADFGSSVMLCKYVQSTGVDWRIEKSHNLPEDIDEIKLSFRNVVFFINPLFCHNEFIFAGTYNSITNTFYIDKWHIVGKINKINRKGSYRNNRLYINEFLLWMEDYMIAYKVQR